jgi:hypothetical protein
MLYALLLYEDEAIYGGVEKTSAPFSKDLLARHMAFQQEIGAARVTSAGLKGTATATTVRSRGGKQTIHDGPFAEAREQLGGLYIVEAPNLDAALAMAKRLPAAGDCAVEVRPLLGR